MIGEGVTGLRGLLLTGQKPAGRAIKSAGKDQDFKIGHDTLSALNPLHVSPGRIPCAVSRLGNTAA